MFPPPFEFCTEFPFLNRLLKGDWGGSNALFSGGFRRKCAPGAPYLTVYGQLSLGQSKFFCIINSGVIQRSYDVTFFFYIIILFSSEFPQ